MTTTDALAPPTQPIPGIFETAGHAVVRTLEEHGIPRVFIVPGESFLEVLDGLHDSPIQTVVCRHEGSAAYMADAEGKLGQLPGVAMVTRGPGAANALVGVHTAWQDSTPLVLFVGLIPQGHREREAFQEFDIKGWFGSSAKRVMVLDTPERAAEVVAEAIFSALSGRPGPVVVGLPEDVIQRPVPMSMHPQLTVARGGMTRADLDFLRASLTASERPLVVTGGNDWDDLTGKSLTQWLERHCIPAAAEWRTQGVVSSSSPSFAGPIGYGRPKPTIDLLDSADLLIYVGTVPGDVLTSGFQARQGWSKRNVIVSMDPALRGRSGAVSHHIVARPDRFVRDLQQIDLPGNIAWRRWTARVRAEHEAFATLPARPSLGAARMDTLMSCLVPSLPDDAIITLGAGEHTNWVHRYMPTAYASSMISAGNGSMGYSVPSAVAASIRHPNRPVLCISGDGEFLMNGQELATARQYGAKPLIVVMDNQEYGTIRTHQERHYPGRVSGTQLVNPDFAGLARSFGGLGIRVERNADIPSAVRSANAHIATEHTSALIHLVVEQRVHAY